MKHTRGLTAVLLGVFFFVTLAAYLLPESGLTVTARNTLYLGSVAVAIVTGLFTVRSYGVPSNHARNFMLIVLGLSFWFIGEAIFTSYVLVNVDPFPSFADVFYLLAYPALAVGFIGEARALRARLTTSSRVLFILFAAVAAGGVLYGGVFRALDPTEPVLSNVVAITYGVADLVLLFATARAYLVAQTFRGGRLAGAWAALFAATLATIVADVLYAVFNANYDAGLQPFTLLDLLWVLAYLLFAYGFVSLTTMLNRVRHKAMPSVLSNYDEPSSSANKPLAR